MMTVSRAYGIPSWARSLFAIAASLLLVQCGTNERPVPAEETGTPNTLPAEMILYREARDGFQQWIRAFAPEREAEAAWPMLSARSKRLLRERGITDASAFASWFDERADGNNTPFSYTLSRFDVLDIDLQDSTRAVVTATFLVHVHQSNFESVGSFILRRERGRWVVPFAESGNFESSWWEKDKQFAMRMNEEGLSRISSETIGVTFRYPVAWDVVSSKTATLPEHAGALPGLELQYIDPSNLSPVAFARVAILPGPLPDSLQAPADAAGTPPLRTLQTRRVTQDRGMQVEGELRTIADPANNRYILVFTGVDAGKASYSQFSETFNAIRNSLKPNTEVLP